MARKPARVSARPPHALHIRISAVGLAHNLAHKRRQPWWSRNWKEWEADHHPRSTNAREPAIFSQILLCKRAHANASPFNDCEVSDPRSSILAARMAPTPSAGGIDNQNSTIPMTLGIRTAQASSRKSLSKVSSTPAFSTAHANISWSVLPRALRCESRRYRGHLPRALSPRRRGNSR